MILNNSQHWPVTCARRCLAVRQHRSGGFVSTAE